MGCSVKDSGSPPGSGLGVGLPGCNARKPILPSPNTQIAKNLVFG
jgi:hypothetical protein